MTTAIRTRAYAPPTPRLFGSRLRWTADGALVGAVTAYGGAALGVFGLSLHPWLVLCGVLGLVLGGGLGFIAPRVLDRLRTRVSLRATAVLVPTLAATTASAVAVVSAGPTSIPLGPALWFAAVAAVVQAAVFWLPYTVATVLRRRRWPVVALACVVGPLTGPLAALCARTAAFLL